MGEWISDVCSYAIGRVFSGGALVHEPPHVGLAVNAPKGFRLGIDPWLHTAAEVRRLAKALSGTGGTLVFVASNPLDAIWEKRPAEPVGAVAIHKVEHAGVLASEKIARTVDLVKEKIGRASCRDRVCQYV